MASISVALVLLALFAYGLRATLATTCTSVEGTSGTRTYCAGTKHSASVICPSGWIPEFGNCRRTTSKIVSSEEEVTQNSSRNKNHGYSCEAKRAPGGVACIRGTVIAQATCRPKVCDIQNPTANDCRTVTASSGSRTVCSGGTVSVTAACPAGYVADTFSCSTSNDGAFNPVRYTISNSPGTISRAGCQYRNAGANGSCGGACCTSTTRITLLCSPAVCDL